MITPGYLPCPQCRHENPAAQAFWLLERLGEEGMVPAMRPYDEIYRQPSGASPLAEVVARLASAAPTDLAEINLRQCRALQPWSDREHLVARGRYWAQVLARVVLEADH